MFLAIHGNRVESVCFKTDGCLNTHACANTVANIAEGKTIEQAWDITPDDIIDYLKTLQPENTHCAELVVGALYTALTNYMQNKDHPKQRG